MIRLVLTVLFHDMDGPLHTHSQFPLAFSCFLLVHITYYLPTSFTYYLCSLVSLTPV